MSTKLEKRKRSSKCIKDQIFKSFQESLHEIELPSPQWGFVKGNNKFFGFQKVETSCCVKKRIALFRNRYVKVFVDDKIVSSYRGKRISNLKELIELLQAVDKMAI